MGIPKLSLLLLSTAAVVRPCLAETKRCYFPNGDVSLSDRPCDSEAENSICCGAPPFGGYCLSNKVCKSLAGLYSRGSCTDPTWQAPECQTFCIPMAQNGGWAMERCSAVTDADVYCCNGTAPDCCDTPAARITLGTSPPFTWATWVGSGTGFNSVVTPLPSTTRSSSTSAKTTTGSSTSSTSTTATSPAETSQPNSAGQSQPSSSPQGLDSSSASLSTGAKVGIGLGSAVGALLIALLAFFLWRANRNNRQLQEALLMQQQQGGGMVNDNSNSNGQYYYPPTAAAAAMGQPMQHQQVGEYYADAGGPHKLELPSESQVHEMGGYPPAYQGQVELPAGNGR
ncbi:hypothetical protein VTI74DRAFT_11373 [Chaetomium olivicolor]